MQEKWHELQSKQHEMTNCIKNLSIAPLFQAEFIFNRFKRLCYAKRYTAV